MKDELDAADSNSKPSSDPLIDELIQSGWNAQAARAVVDLNAEWYDIQREENPPLFNDRVKSLRRLGRREGLTDVLIAHPETAGLLAGVANPSQVAASLSKSERDYHQIAGCYVQRPAPDDAAMLAAALERHHEVIVDFLRRGLIGGEAIFIFDRDEPSIGAYDDWLKETLQAQDKWSDDQRGSFVNFAMRQGPGIRKRMREDPGFSRSFREDLWPKLKDLASRDEQMYEQYIDDDRIWDMLSRDDGQQLLVGGGPLAIDLIYGNRELDHAPYPEEYHDRVAQLLAMDDVRAFDALLRYRDEPRFHNLISRELTTDTLRAAFDKLLATGAANPTLLARFADIKSDGALAEEVGPPPSGLITWVPFYYTVYEVPKKLIQGRDPSAMEWFSAIADPAFLVVDIATAGNGRVVREAIVKGGVAVTEKQAGKAVATTLKNTGLELAERQLATRGVGELAVKKGVEKIGERGLASWTVTRTLGNMQRVVGKAIGKATTFEITKPVQFAFRYGGVGRGSWKRWTGMDARLFMRGDARVFVRLPNLAGAVVGSRAAAFIEQTARDLSLGVALETEPGQKATKTTTRAVLSVPEQLAQWRRNVSAWWYLNAGDEIKREGNAQ